MADGAPRHGLEIELRPLRPETSPARLAREAGAEVVVVDSIVASRVRAVALDVPVIASVHQRPGGLVGSVPARLARAVLDVRCYRGADAVVVPSTYLASLLRRTGVVPSRIDVVEPGSDLPLGPPRARRAEASCRIVAVANLSAHKRPLELLDAFATMGDLDASLTLIGGAADADVAVSVERRLAARDLAGRASWVGSLPAEAIAADLAASDVVVSPALGESYGMAVVEALRLGVPAVVSRSGNLPNVVRDGIDGFVVPARDMGAFSAAMRRLVIDARLRASMAQSAALGAGRFPTWDATAERFAAVLERVRSRSRAPTLRPALASAGLRTRGGGFRYARGRSAA